MYSFKNISFFGIFPLPEVFSFNLPFDTVSSTLILVEISFAFLQYAWSEDCNVAPKMM
jgi:hypothetical protein